MDGPGDDAAGDAGPARPAVGSRPAGDRAGCGCRVGGPRGDHSDRGAALGTLLALLTITGWRTRRRVRRGPRERVVGVGLVGAAALCVACASTVGERDVADADAERTDALAHADSSHDVDADGAPGHADTSIADAAGMPGRDATAAPSDVRDVLAPKANQDARVDTDAASDALAVADALAVSDVVADAPAPCALGERCDGVCVETRSDPANCGGCGLRCEAVAGGSARCAAGTCVVDCDAATELLAGACVPGRFHLIAPVSAARVTSRRPALRWRATPGQDGASVYLCRARDCRAETAQYTLESTTTSVRPADDLDPGVWFWRVAARSGGALTGESTPVWEFVVGVRSAVVDASGPGIVDVNGDGLADAVVSATYAAEYDGAIHMYAGTPGGLLGTPQSLAGPDVASYPGGFYGTSLVGLGDVDGDGFGDIAAMQHDPLQFVVHRGGAAGLDVHPWGFTPPPPGDRFASVGVRGVGDIDGDGYSDVVYFESRWGTTTSLLRVDLYRGGPTGTLAPPVTVYSESPGSDLWQARVAPAGDIDADGYADVVVSLVMFGRATRPSEVIVLRGGPLGLRHAQTLISPTPLVSTPFGSAIAAAGDVDGDGFADLLVADSRYSNRLSRAWVPDAHREGPRSTAGFATPSVVRARDAVRGPRSRRRYAGVALWRPRTTARRRAAGERRPRAASTAGSTRRVASRSRTGRWTGVPSMEAPCALARDPGIEPGASAACRPAPCAPSCTYDTVAHGLGGGR